VFALVLAGLSGAGAGVISGGCDGESSFDIPPVDAGAPSSVYHAACEAWATSYCAFQAACPAQYTVYSQGVCVPRNTLRCEIIATDPNVPFDPARVAVCGEPDAANCDQPPAGGDLCLPPGRGRVGTRCLTGEACQSGFCAYSYIGGAISLCGTCTARVCDGGCPAGLTCSSSGDAGLACVKMLAVGEKCSTAIACQTFYCGRDGKCGALAKRDASCANDGTSGPPCADNDTFCDPTNHCSPVVPAGYGAACAPAGNVAYQCTGFGTCDYMNNACIPPAADGEFCDDMQGLNCAFPAQCVAHRCLFPNLEQCGN
jgi:hypothetical protein